KEESEINTILSKMEDFIQERHKHLEKLHSLYSENKCTFSESGGHVNPPSVLEATKKKSNKTQHLYRKLCHIDKELSLLGPSSFQNPHSYSQALKQSANHPKGSPKTPKSSNNWPISEPEPLSDY
uniref:Uncharacterized protein n=1 Tax=Oryzias melastigma TaxID=30732 RepID=A0A3B3BXP4_ORYME